MTFDRYIDNSTKSGTRKNRSRKARPIRKIVDGRTVPLPQNWNDFLAVPANKQDLALLLSNELITQAPGDKIIVVAGGFRTAEDTQCTQPLVDIEMLRANHKEADTRVVLHCIHAETEDVVVAARDTDILLLLLAFFSSMKLMLGHMFNIINGNAPTYLISGIIMNQHRYSTRARELSCVIPRVKSSGLTSFMYQGVCYWNKLPLEIKQCPSKDTFKYQVKCLLYIIVYLRRKPVYMYVLNCIDRMFFACMLSDDGKLIICIGPHWK